MVPVGDDGVHFHKSQRERLMQPHRAATWLFGGGHWGIVPWRGPHHFSKASQHGRPGVKLTSHPKNSMMGLMALSERGIFVPRILQV
jgi:hypothetical protein